MIITVMTHIACEGTYSSLGTLNHYHPPADRKAVGD